MSDAINLMFEWMNPLVERIPAVNPQLTNVEQEIISAFRAGWGKTDGAELLRSLTQSYGDLAGETVEKVLAPLIAADWKKLGDSQAHAGTEIEDFINLLWVPLEKQGFEFTSKNEGDKVVFNVTQCPVFEVAQRTGLHKWLFHLACATDPTSACAFSPKIRFERTKTLMEGSDHCDHTYIRGE